MASEQGMFLIYPTHPMGERFKTVRRAVARIAERLEVDVEVSQRNVLSTWVYYRNDGEEVPIYSDWGKQGWSPGDVYQSIRSVVYALSFHPQYQVLQGIREVKTGWR